MKKGYMVIDSCEEYEQILCLEKGDGLPENGVLTWPNGGLDRIIFPDKKSARKALQRTHYYALAFGRTDMPDKAWCKIVGVSWEVE